MKARRGSAIVIAGFMATGKSTTGRNLAARLSRPFVDLDAEIEARCGMRIPEIFARQGEQCFRAREREALIDVAARRNLVLALGGGTLKSPENRDLLRRSGVLVCLTADIDTILARTSGTGGRPLLALADEQARRDRIRRLLAEREHIYAGADLYVDTSEASPLQVTDAIIKALRRRGAIRN